MTAAVGLVEFADEQPWAREGLCAQTDPELFYPEKGESNKEAKRICMGCPVRRQCLEYALAVREPFGVWGGTSERERSRMLAKRAPGRPSLVGTPKMCGRRLHVMEGSNVIRRADGKNRCGACWRESNAARERTAAA